MKNTLEWINVVLGGWLFVSPWIFGFTGNSGAAWSAWLVGGLVLILAAWALSDKGVWEDWVNALIAAIGFFTPWFAGYASLSAAAWNMWIVALAIFVVALWAAYSPTTAATT
ncbi:SPW repeat protein [Oceanithermus sp.]